MNHLNAADSRHLPGPLLLPSSLLPDIAIAELYGFRNTLRSVIVFGSVARGDASTTSDIDLLVITTKPSAPSGKVSSEFRRSYKASLLRLKVNHAVKPKVVEAVTCDGVEATVLVDSIPTSFIFRLAKPSPLYFSLIDNCLTLIDKQRHMARALTATRSLMKRLMYGQMPLGTGWYWRPGTTLTCRNLHELGFYEKGRWSERQGRTLQVKSRIAANHQLAITLLHQSIRFFLKAWLAFSGILPIKCEPWEHLILQREPSSLSDYPGLRRLAVTIKHIENAICRLTTQMQKTTNRDLNSGHKSHATKAGKPRSQGLTDATAG